MPLILRMRTTDICQSRTSHASHVAQRKIFYIYTLNNKSAKWGFEQSQISGKVEIGACEAKADTVSFELSDAMTGNWHEGEATGRWRCRTRNPSACLGVGVVDRLPKQSKASDNGWASLWTIIKFILTCHITSHASNPHKFIHTSFRLAKCQYITSHILSDRSQEISRHGQIFMQITDETTGITSPNLLRSFLHSYNSVKYIDWFRHK